MKEREARWFWCWPMEFGCLNMRWFWIGIGERTVSLGFVKRVTRFRLRYQEER